MVRYERLFLQNGYLDMAYVMSLPFTYIIIAGGRGIGKSYGALYEAHEHPEYGTLYLRSMQKEHDIIRKPAYSPYSWHNKDFGWNVQPYKEDKIFSTWAESVLDEETGKMMPAGEPFMWSAALYDIAAVRGFNGAHINWIIYDEFNPQKGIMYRIGDDDFANCYETINRNRELEGMPPVKCLLLSNSNNIDNAVYRGFNLVNRVERMKRNGQYISEMYAQGILLIILPETEIGNKKRQTALYKATAGTEYSRMALDNEFTNDTPSEIRPMSLKGMRALVKTWDFAIYLMQDKETYYVTEFTGQKHMDMITRSHSDILRMRKEYRDCWAAYISGGVVFESYTAETRFKKIFVDNPKNM